MLLVEDDKLVHIDSSADILEHYGVKGMKWGKRKVIDTVSRSFNRIKDNHRKNIEYSYRKKGYSEDEVQRRTEKRLKLEKAAVTAAGAALATYGAYKLGKHINDEYIPSNLRKGKSLHTVMRGDSIDLERGFYAARKGDKKNYKDTWGAIKAAEAQDMGLSGANQFNMRVDKKLKVASHHRAAKEFNKLMKKDELFRRNVMARYNESGKYLRDGINDKYFDALASGKRNKKAYDAYNIMYQMNRGYNNNKFEKALKNKGYDAIVDMNDTLFRTQPNAKHKPVIVFNAKDKLKIVGKEHIAFKDMDYIRTHNGMKASNKHDADLLNKGAAVMDQAIKEMRREESLKKLKKDSVKTATLAGLAAVGSHSYNTISREDEENKLVKNNRSRRR